MAPRPSSHNDPSSWRAISYSPKTGEANSSPGQSKAARTRHARHSPFGVNVLPHVEQSATCAGEAFIPSAAQHPEELVEFYIHLRLAGHGLPYLGAQQFPVTDPQTRDVTAQRGSRQPHFFNQLIVRREPVRASGQ